MYDMIDNARVDPILYGQTFWVGNVGVGQEFWSGRKEGISRECRF